MPHSSFFPKKFMKKYVAIVLLFGSIAFVVPVSAFAKALAVEVFPEKVCQGDVFLVTVTGGALSEPPSGSFAKQQLDFSECGEGLYCAVGAVDIVTKPGRHTVRVSAGNGEKTAGLSVKKTRFPEVTIYLPEEKVTLSLQDRERVERENIRVRDIFETLSDRRWEGSFMIPLNNNVSAEFGIKRIMNGKAVSIHRGVDIRGKAGEKIRASNHGKIVLAEDLFFGGNTIIIDHGQGLYTIYMHLSKFEGDVNDSVARGDVIGYVGSTGRSTGPHLHFGVKLNTISVNPFSLTRLPL